MAFGKDSSLADTLREFEQTPPHMGERTSVRSKDELERFQKNLRAVSGANRVYFTIAVVMICILFLGALALVVYFLDKPNYIAAIFGVTGISLTGIIVQMTRLWKDKVRSDTLLVLAGGLPQKELKDIVAVMLKAEYGAAPRKDEAVGIQGGK